MTAFYSNFLPGVPSNFLPGNTGAQPFMMVAANNSDGMVHCVGYLTLGANDTPDIINTYTPAHYYLDGGGNKVIILEQSWTTYIPANGNTCTITWDLGDTSNDDSVVKYPCLVLDVNQNGTFESDTDKLVADFNQFPFRTVWRTNYIAAVGVLTGGGGSFARLLKGPLTSRLLSTFLNGAPPDADVQSGTFRDGGIEKIAPSFPGQSHNVGLDYYQVGGTGPFTGTASAWIQRWIIPANEPLHIAWKVSQTSELYAMLKTTILAHNQEIRNACGQVRKGPGNMYERDFGPWPVLVATSTGTAVATDLTIDSNSDLAYSIHGTTLKHGNALKGLNCYVTVAATGRLTIEKVILAGYLEDLYDFDRTKNFPASWAAVVQTGYSKANGLGTYGKLFFTQVNLTGVDMAAQGGLFYNVSLNILQQQ